MFTVRTYLTEFLALSTLLYISDILYRNALRLFLLGFLYLSMFNIFLYLFGRLWFVVTASCRGGQCLFIDTMTVADASVIVVRADAVVDWVSV